MAHLGNQIVPTRTWLLGLTVWCLLGAAHAAPPAWWLDRTVTSLPAEELGFGQGPNANVAFADAMREISLQRQAVVRSSVFSQTSVKAGRTTSDQSSEVQSFVSAKVDRSRVVRREVVDGLHYVAVASVDLPTEDYLAYRADRSGVLTCPPTGTGNVTADSPAGQRLRRAFGCQPAAWLDHQHGSWTLRVDQIRVAISMDEVPAHFADLRSDLVSLQAPAALRDGVGYAVSWAASGDGYQASFAVDEFGVVRVIQAPRKVAAGATGRYSSVARVAQPGRASYGWFIATLCVTPPAVDDFVHAPETGPGVAPPSLPNFLTSVVAAPDCRSAASRVTIYP